VSKDNLKAMAFAAVTCILAALILSVSAAMFKPQQVLNIQLDIKKNILKALDISEAPLADAAAKQAYYGQLTAATIQELYSQRVRELVVDAQGNEAQGRTPASIRDGEGLLPVYKSVQGETVEAWCIPVSGKGLWSTIYGYMALETDLNTVKGVTFYKHGETPGLGAEVDQPWFQNNFTGKKILDSNGQLKSVRVKKGKVDGSEPDAAHLVDGISGATMTGNGVNRFLEENLRAYENFFKKVRNNG
jgi:Na+-transporting NADH:ubiquinone oxidoreductase subunit C